MRRPSETIRPPSEASWRRRAAGPSLVAPIHSYAALRSCLILAAGGWCAQVQTVLDAVRAPGEEFIFEGEKIPIKKSCGIFLTMNPVCIPSPPFPLLPLPPSAATASSSLGRRSLARRQPLWTFPPGAYVV